MYSPSSHSETPCPSAPLSLAPVNFFSSAMFSTLFASTQYTYHFIYIYRSNLLLLVCFFSGLSCFVGSHMYVYFADLWDISARNIYFGRSLQMK